MRPTIGEDEHNIESLTQPKLPCTQLLHAGEYFHVPFDSAILLASVCPCLTPVLYAGTTTLRKA